MATTGLSPRDGAPTSAAGTPAIAAASSAGAAPSGGTDGVFTGQFPSVRTLVDYTGTVTAAVLRLYTKVGGAWYRGGSSDDFGPLTPASGDESLDWTIGRHTEFLFVLEAIAQTGGGTVAVTVVGIDA